MSSYCLHISLFTLILVLFSSCTFAAEEPQDANSVAYQQQQYYQNPYQYHPAYLDYVYDDGDNYASAYQQQQQEQNGPSFTGAIASYLGRQDGGLDGDPAIFVGIAAVAILAIGTIGAIATANELSNLRSDIDSNDSDINTLTTRTNSACTALNTIGNLAAAPTAGDAATNAARINSIITAANGANCT